MEFTDQLFQAAAMAVSLNEGIMEISEMKNKIEVAIKALPPLKLKIALDFLEDLQRSDEDETRILLNDPGFMEDYRNAKEDIRTGKTISWEDIKQDV